MNEILIPVLILAGMGLILGAMLGIAAKIFAVKKDERIEAIEAILPGANCGGCGYPGCSGYANAIVNDGVSVNLCAAGGEETALKIGEIIANTREEKIFLKKSWQSCLQQKEYM